MKKSVKLFIVLLSVGSLFGVFVSNVFSDTNDTQYIPQVTFRIGPYAAGGSGMTSGYIDYLTLINKRDNGINGVKFSWSECETEYKTPRGVECYERLKNHGSGATVFNFFSTGMTYAVLERATKDKIPIMSLGYGRTDTTDGRVFPYIFPLITNYSSQNTAKVKYIGQVEGGMDKLKGKLIVNLHHGSGYGRETMPILEIQAKKYGFRLKHIEVAHPGVDQKSQWLQIRRLKPDWVILRGWGIMNPTALKMAANMKFPANRIIGVWWSGAEEDVRPAGDAAIGYRAAGFHPAGVEFPLLSQIKEALYDKGEGNLKDKTRIGSVYHIRGIIHGVVTAEAIRTAHKKFGNRVITGEEMRWGLENLNITAERIKEIGMEGMLMPLKISCRDHEGGGAVKFMEWDGKKWNVVSDWIQSDQSIVRPMIESSAAKYAEEKGIKIRTCE